MGIFTLPSLSIAKIHRSVFTGSEHKTREKKTAVFLSSPQARNNTGLPTGTKGKAIYWSIIELA